MSRTKFSTGYKKKPSANPNQHRQSKKKTRSASYAAAYGATKTQQQNVTTPPPPPPKSRSGYTRSRGRTRQTFKPKGLPTPNPTPVLDYLKRVYHGIDRDQPGAEAARSFLKDEIKSIDKAGKEVGKHLLHGELPGSYRSSGNELSAGLTIASIAAGGGLAKGAEKAAKAGERAVTAASDTNWAKTAAKTAAEEAKGAPARVAKAAKEAPGKVKAAPGKAVVKVKKGGGALKTPAGRKAAAKGVGRAARRHPVRSAYAASLPIPEGAVPGDPGKRARALAQGTGEALYHNPLGTAEATAKGVYGAVAAPLALAYSAGESALEGNPAPLANTAKTQGEGLLELGGKVLSGNPKTVRETAEKEIGVLPFTGIPALTRVPGVRKLGAKVRAKVPYLENRATRKRVAREVRQETAPARSQAAYWQKKVLKPLKKAKHTRSLRNVHGMEAGDLLQTLAEYGVRTIEDVKYLRKHGPVGEGLAGQVTLKAALDFAEKHPEILTDKHFKKALEGYIEGTHELPAAKANKGERARLMGQGDMLKVLRPEDRVPVAARQWTTAKTRKGAWEQVARTKKAIARDRGKGKELAARAQEATGARREALKAEAATYYHAAKVAEIRNAQLSKALGKYSRPDQALRSGARRKFYDKPLLDEYRAEVEAARTKAGLSKAAWTHHAKFREPGEVAPPYPTAGARVQHMRSGALSEADRIDRSLRGLVSGSIVGPRLQAGAQGLARRFTADEALPVKVGGKTKRLVTADQFSELVKAGDVNPNRYVLFPARQFKQAVLDPYKTQGELSSLASKGLEQDLRLESPGNKYVIVSKTAAREFAGQIDPRVGSFMKALNVVSKGTSRWLLLSPTWAMIQTVAEGATMVMGHPRLLLDPTYIARLEARIRKNTKLRPNEAKAFAATAGEAPTALATPNEIRPALGSNPHGVFSDGARALTRNPVGQAMFSVARMRPLAVFDAWRQAKYRELLMAAEADKRLNGWGSHLKEMLHLQRRISDELKNLPKDEQLAALTKPKYRKLLDEMQTHVENLQGDWQTFTEFERGFAPALVFYPFIRYSLRWPLTFAKQHPIQATIYNFLGALNAQQVENILGHAPNNPLAFAIPVYQNAEGESRMLPVGPRAAPGLSAPTQAIVSGQPSQLLSMLQPLGGATITGLTGVNPYTGRQEAMSIQEKGELFANQLLATAPLLRYLGVKLGDESVASETYNAIDEHKGRRSFLTPWESISAQQFKETENFGRSQKEKYSNPVPDIWDNPEIGEAIYGGEGSREVDWAKVKELLKEKRKAEAAGERSKRFEEPFYPEDEGNSEFGPERKKALELLRGGVFIPSDEEHKGQYGGGLGGQYGGSGQYSDGLKGQYGGEGQYGGKTGAVQEKSQNVKLPNIEGFEHSDQKEFAEWFSHYSKIPPKLAGEWVKQEGGGYSNGGEAGEQNWLGVGYPGHQTAFSQSPHFNGTSPKKAAKATVAWMEGKIGGEYGYPVAGSVKGILALARSGAPESEIRSYIEGGSGWGTGAIAQSGVAVNGSRKGEPAPKKIRGEWAGTKSILLSAAKGYSISSEKRSPAHNAEVGGSPTSDHLTTNVNTFATDIPTTNGVPIAQKVAKRLGIKGWGPGNYNWYSSAKYPGYRFQLLWAVPGHYDHVHAGAEWVGEGVPAGTVSGGSVTGAVPVSTGSTGAYVPAKAQRKRRKRNRPPQRNYWEVMEQLESLGVPVGGEEEAPPATPVLSSIKREYARR